jgi:hypothetical protein
MRTVVANFSLSLDGRLNGPQGEYDMGWIVPHAISDASRDHMVAVTEPPRPPCWAGRTMPGLGLFGPPLRAMSQQTRETALSQHG